MNFKRLLAPWPLAIIIIVICGAATLIFDAFYTYTSDAYLSANIVTVSPQVSGTVKIINAVDNQTVQQGQLLFQIDPAPFNDAVLSAQGNVNLAISSYNNLAAQAQATQAQIENAKANQQWWQSEFNRIEPLVKKGVISKERGSQIYYSMQEATAKWLQAKQNLLAIQAQMGPNEDAFPPLAVARANLKVAQENLSYTTLNSSVAGKVVNFQLRVGQYVDAGEDLFALIDEQNMWIVARFKETALRHIQPGAKVAVYFDMYPLHKFEGVVQSIGWGVNREQNSNTVVPSSLPYLEQTEYWVRLSQRFPVRIAISHPDPAYPLRVGASARVFVEH